MVEAATTECVSQGADIAQNTEVDIGEMPPKLPPHCLNVGDVYLDGTPLQRSGWGRRSLECSRLTPPLRPSAVRCVRGVSWENNES
jgi:hypothetical protein